jgi:hypothetical protein
LNIPLPLPYHQVVEMLDRAQLGVIFDLDETLLGAQTLSSAEGRLNSVRNQK